ncbi:MAG: succinylglutamate desuccinylase/aspartoacylase family protein [Saprospiraceae bacterium]|nr:succinylglutamate desuccinylase/aspartoacylase family protein [Saprospiraceae bacterium]
MSSEMPDKALKILNTPILPGQSITLSLDIARLHTHTKIEVPIIVERAKKEGPCLLLLAGIHGNEVNGVEIVRRIVAGKYNKPQRGMVICVPVLNVFGFLNQTREFPDGRDLNRFFPGSKTGSLASRFAWNFMKHIVPHIDYCIDFHTGGASRFNYTQLRIDRDKTECLDLAKTFGARFIIYAPHRDKSFRQSAGNQGKTVLLFEGGKTLHLDRAVTQSGIEGTIRVMHHLGLRDFSKEIAGFAKIPKPILVKKSSWVRAKYSGMFRSALKTATKVHKGDIIGTITDPFGKFQSKVKAPWDGYILATNHHPIVNQGHALVHLSEEIG